MVELRPLPSWLPLSAYVTFGGATGKHVDEKYSVNLYALSLHFHQFHKLANNPKVVSDGQTDFHLQSLDGSCNAVGVRWHLFDIFNWPHYLKCTATLPAFRFPDFPAHPPHRHGPNWGLLAPGSPGAE
uniref:HDC19640 n=1 Tax=Drosophila melanogaster TaxID=7227 RepID=Q6II64_DROME|nr:TPA_inf: HDC19640 [Drosophila melanogaster]